MVNLNEELIIIKANLEKDLAEMKSHLLTELEGESLNNYRNASRLEISNTSLLTDINKTDNVFFLEANYNENL